MKTRLSIDIRNSITEALLNLGKTPNQVAETLRQRGITGKPREECQCPIAKVAQEAIAPYKRTDLQVYVKKYFVFVFSTNDNDNFLIDMEATVPVKEFMIAFDSGQYDYLDSEKVSRNELFQYCLDRRIKV